MKGFLKIFTSVRDDKLYTGRIVIPIHGNHVFRNFTAHLLLFTEYLFFPLRERRYCILVHPDDGVSHSNENKLVFFITVHNLPYLTGNNAQENDLYTIGLLQYVRLNLDGIFFTTSFSHV